MPDTRIRDLCRHPAREVPAPHRGHHGRQRPLGGPARAGAHPRAPAGRATVRDVVTECARLRKHHGGPDFLTLYSFSIENWKRPANEVSFLMQMYIEYLRRNGRR